MFLLISQHHSIHDTKLSSFYFPFPVCPSVLIFRSENAEHRTTTPNIHAPRWIRTNDCSNHVTDIHASNPKATDRPTKGYPLSGRGELQLTKEKQNCVLQGNRWLSAAYISARIHRRAAAPRCAASCWPNLADRTNVCNTSHAVGTNAVCCLRPNRLRVSC